MLIEMNEVEAQEIDGGGEVEVSCGVSIGVPPVSVSCSVQYTVKLSPPPANPNAESDKQLAKTVSDGFNATRYLTGQNDSYSVYKGNGVYVR